MNAVVLLNKPVGVRSTRCVAIVRKSFGGLKAGHAGTLDSTASGLLVLLLGHATRFSEYIMSLPKVYRVNIQFGIETNTYDYSGDIVAEKPCDYLDAKMIDDALYQFSGYRLQKPPAVSAVKIDGTSAYKLARSGQDVDPKARPVFFRSIKRLSGIVDGSVSLEVSCGRGTYIRSLAHDLGAILGTGAHVKSLERISVGNFRLEDADDIESEDFRTLTLSDLARNYTRIHVGERDAKSFVNGMSILLRQAESFSRGVSVMNNICVEGDNFLGFGTYAGYDYIRPVVIVPK